MAVIPAGMPESSHRESMARVLDLAEHKSNPYDPPHYHPWLWIPASLPDEV
ncbi:MAG: hypothetical protein HOP02_13180 [Methylococcaceae bacterium]|nr:hypothetical protein [Methylococcaceae bacterium]